VRCDIASNFFPACGVTDVDGIREIELLHKLGEIGWEGLEVSLARKSVPSLLSAGLRQRQFRRRRSRAGGEIGAPLV
jgi:hypothetical protein